MNEISLPKDLDLINIIVTKDDNKKYLLDYINGSSGSNSDAISGGAIAGYVILGVVVIIVIIIVLIVLRRMWKRKKIRKFNLDMTIKNLGKKENEFRDAIIEVKENLKKVSENQKSLKLLEELLLNLLRINGNGKIRPEFSFIENTIKLEVKRSYSSISKVELLIRETTSLIDYMGKIHDYQIRRSYNSY